MIFWRAVTPLNKKHMLQALARLLAPRGSPARCYARYPSWQRAGLEALVSLAQLRERRLVRFIRKLAAVACLKLFPTRRVVPKPATQRIARSDIAQPVIQARLLTLHPTRLQAINQHPLPILYRWRVINALDLDLKCTHDIPHWP